jgi:hypothetical protein
MAPWPTSGLSRTRRGSLPTAPLVIAALAALLYSNFLLDWVLRGFEGMGQVVSALEAPGQPNAILLRVTDVVSAVLVVYLLPPVRARLVGGGWREVFVGATLLFAIGAVLAAVVATPCGPGVTCVGSGQQLATAVHEYSSITSDTALYVGVGAAWFSTRGTGPGWFRRAAWWAFGLGGVVLTIIFGYFNWAGDPAWAIGASQRAHIVGISVWIVCLGLFAARPVGAPTTGGPVAASLTAHAPALASGSATGSGR